MLLRITLKTSAFIRAAAILALLLIFGTFGARISNSNISSSVYRYAFYFPTFLLNCLMLFYMISVLIFYRQQKYIVASYVIFLAYSAVQIIISQLFRNEAILALFITRINPLLFYLAISYLLITSLFISQRGIMLPFALYASSLIIPILFIFFIRLSAYLIDNYSLHLSFYYFLIKHINDFATLFSVVLPSSIFWLTHIVNKSLKYGHSLDY